MNEDYFDISKVTEPDEQDIKDYITIENITPQRIRVTYELSKKFENFSEDPIKNS